MKQKCISVICVHIYFDEEKNSCGPFKRWDQDGIFHVDELSTDITNHL